MKFTKKLFGFALLCVLMLIPSKAEAARMTQVTPNVPFVGELETADTEHYYSFTVNNTGYFNIEFKPVDVTLNTEDGWHVELHDGETGEEIYGYTVKKGTTLPISNFKKGTKLYIAVKSAINSPYYSPYGQEYSINIKTTNHAYWEQENNNKASTATNMSGNKTYYGHLYNSSDEDYYRYTVGTTGYVDLNFGLGDITDDTEDGWKVSINDADTNKELKSFTTDKPFTCSYLNLKKGTKLIIKVEAYIDSPYYAPIAVPYTLTFKETSAGNWDKETFVNATSDWKSRTKNATSISLGKEYFGNLWNSSDDDMYKISTSKNGYVTLKFNPNDVESNLGYGYQISFFDSKGKLVTKKTAKGVYSKKYYLAKGTYYVAVTSQSSFGCPKSNYSVKAGFKSSTPGKIKSFKARRAKLSWKKTSGVSGYQISYATKSSFKGAKTKTTSKISYTLKGLKSKKTYYVRIRAYKKTSTGGKAYGSWSKKIKVRK